MGQCRIPVSLGARSGASSASTPFEGAWSVAQPEGVNADKSTTNSMHMRTDSGHAPMQASAYELLAHVMNLKMGNCCGILAARQVLILQMPMRATDWR